MAKEDIPSLKQSVKEGWSGLLLPVVILLPFIFDAVCNTTFLTARLGSTGASYFSKSLLIFTAGVTTVFGILISKDRKKMTPVEIVSSFAGSLKGLVPTVATCILGYMIGAMFTDLNVGEDLQAAFEAMNFNMLTLALVIPLMTCFISMVIPGSSIVVMLGEVFIAVFANAGANPLLVAAMLPCICGVMCGITPPFALGMYAGMSIAKSDFTKTLKNDLWWLAAQYVLEVIILLGVLPVLGL